MGTDRYMRNFAFDSVLLEGSTQADLFQLARVREMLAGVMNGFHATVFAYGQTGSGKTHCMEGFKYKRLKVSPPLTSPLRYYIHGMHYDG
jgi:chromosomal replication initiation ATPase DnaA